MPATGLYNDYVSGVLHVCHHQFPAGSMPVAGLSDRIAAGW